MLAKVQDKNRWKQGLLRLSIAADFFDDTYILVLSFTLSFLKTGPTLLKA